MKRIYALAAGVLALGISTASFAFSSAEELRSYLRRLEPKLEQAFAKEDIKVFAEVSTADFTYTDAAGKTQTKKQSLQGMQQMFAMGSNLKVKFQLGKVEAKGNVGTAKYTGHFTMNIPGPEGKSQRMEVHTWTAETYKKVGNKWLVHKIVETKPSKMMVNGKPFDPTKMGAPEPPKKAKIG